MKKMKFWILIAIAIVIGGCLDSCSPKKDEDDPVIPEKLEKPIVKTVSVVGLGYDSIIATGVVLNNKQAKVTSCGMKYSSYIKDGTVSGVIIGDTFRVRIAIQPGIPYNVYAFAKNSVGTSAGQWLKYIYSASGPKMSSPEAIDITDVSGVACDTIDNCNLPTTVTIYYGNTSNYTDSTNIYIINKKTVVIFSFPGLESGTEKHFCFKAKNELGTVKTNDAVFYTGVKDIDGNLYPVTKIGNQLWIAKDLRVTHYNDGTPILNPIPDAYWIAAGNARTGAYCYYNNDTEIGKEYGALYNWYAINTGKLAIKGWHVPNYNEWIQMLLANYRDLHVTNDGCLKETGYAHWKSPNAGATNVTGFTALPSGHRSYSRDYVMGFWDLHLSAVWWTADEWTEGYTRIMYMDHDKTDVFNNLVGQNWYGESVRIIKDSE